MNKKTSKSIHKTKMLCEAAVFLALAQILSYVRFYKFPNGGSVDCAMLPIILFALRYGSGWGTAVGFVYGILQYFSGGLTAIDWTSILGDYIIAYMFLGFGAGLFARKTYGVYWGSISGCVLRFLVHWVVGAVIWGKWMPDTFFGMDMTNEWFYSLLYNGSYMLLCLVVVLALFAVLYKPLKKYFTAEDLA